MSDLKALHPTTTQLLKFNRKTMNELKLDTDKVKSIGAPKGGFYLLDIYLNEKVVYILFSDEKNNLSSLLINDVIHFQRTDENYKLDTFFDLLSPNPNVKSSLLLQGECFFEVVDNKYTEWVLREHYFPLDENCKLYAFFFSESYVEVLSYNQPIFTHIDNKYEYYKNLKRYILMGI